jgi:hypothetical protein
MTKHILDTVRTVAGGVGIALAFANGFFNPTTGQNWIAALVGAALGVALVVSAMRGNA